MDTNEESETLQEKLQTKDEEENNYQNMQEENTISNVNPPVYTNNYTNINQSNQNTQINVQATKSSSSDDTHTMWYDLSLISWFLLLCTSLCLFKANLTAALPVTTHLAFIPMFFDISVIGAFVSVISTIGFIFYFKNTALAKNQSYISAFQGDMTKFHFVPLLLMSFVFIILSDFPTSKSCVFGLILSLLSCGSLGFIYFKTELEAEWYEIITTKKGTYSCLIALSWYSFFYFCAGLTNKDNYNGIGILFSFIVSLGNLGLAFYFGDVIIAITNLLIFLGLGKYFYNIEEYDKSAPGIIDIIMIILSFGVIFYLLNKQREKIFKS
jgi:hypothetical protein